MIASLLFWIGTISGSPCQPVAGDRIMASELGAEFESLPASTAIGYAPAPGARRTFQPEELARLAGIHGITLTAPKSVCFEWPMRELTTEDLTAAMQRDPALGNAKIEIVDRSRVAVPPGDILFPRSSLPRPAAYSSTEFVLWRGYVTYASNKRFGIWAKIRIAVPQTRVMTMVPIKAGEPIRKDQVRSESIEEFPFQDGVIRKEEEAVGRISHRSLPAGTPLMRQYLGVAPDIAKGDAIVVEARTGSARISIEAKAETAGRAGESIEVRNLSSGKLFRAKVEGKGKASVAAPGVRP